MTMTEQSSSVPSSPVDDEVPGPARSTGRPIQRVSCRWIRWSEITWTPSTASTHTSGSGTSSPAFARRRHNEHRRLCLEAGFLPFLRPLSRKTL